MPSWLGLVQLLSLFLLWGHSQENLDFIQHCCEYLKSFTIDTSELEKPKVHVIENGNWQGLTNDMIGFCHVHNSFDLANANIVTVWRKKCTLVMACLVRNLPSLFISYLMYINSFQIHATR